jgi:restriction endonuclease Mrr
VEAASLRRRRGTRSGKGSGDLGIVLVVVVLFGPIALLNAALVELGLPKESMVTVGIATFIYLILIGVVVWVWVRRVVIPKRKAEEERKQHLQQRLEQQEEERRRKREQQEEEARRKHEQLEEERRREEQERAEQIEALLERDTFRDSVSYMTGTQFENFMANVFDKKGYDVLTTPSSGDQGVDLLLTIDERKVAVQLKRYTGPVGNAAVQAVVAGMFHYKAKEAWVITTSTFTKSARQLAKSNRVRLIDGRELEDWLNDLREEADNPSPSLGRQRRRRRY